MEKEAVAGQSLTRIGKTRWIPVRPTRVTSSPAGTGWPRILLNRGLSHGEELLGLGGMDTDGGIKRCLGQPAVECDCETLHDFARIRPNEVNPQDAIGQIIHDTFHKRFLIA